MKGVSMREKGPDGPIKQSQIQSRKSAAQCNRVPKPKPRMPLELAVDIIEFRKQAIVNTNQAMS
jgi:hypothetical protein